MESDAHISAIRKRLNKSNYSSDDFSPEGGEEVLKFKPAEEEPLTRRNSGETRTLHGNFTDEEVDLMFRKLQHYNGRMFDFDELRLTPYDSLLWNLKKRNRRRGNYLPAYRNYDGSGLANWEKFQKGINQYFMYDPDDPAIDGMVEEMATLPVIDVEQKEGGTQLKLIITFNDEGQALFKPMRFPREQETLPNHFYFSDYERHNAEIAAFHLDRVLGFYRVPPVAGRVFNMTFEIKRFADRKLAKTFFISPANNVCFHGSCSYYCDSGHAICGHPDTVEASLAAFLPPEKMGKRKTWRNPWKRSYSKHRKAYWEVYDDLCDKVRDKPPYNNGRRLQDLIDTHVFDFLQGNLDRHHYETFRDFGNNTFHMHLDNGRGFGKSKADEHTILAPLYQCCVIRYSTFMKLAKLYIGPEKMSILVKKSLLRDRVSPVVLDVHLIALDRRVMKILREVAQCLEKGLDVTEVIVDDFF
ncbi:hypothetical protein FSP39_000214 [Pinctada imbricata]|uniref:FAM20 C-terminal domain-containing protein n=1 Tax=Pinctada imbricata TaxID=66713 RepID=A0AA88XUW2_PINIB|nr:hypothetical protein FSP39_000214 [Pinctada imbricata]